MHRLRSLSRLLLGAALLASSSAAEQSTSAPGNDAEVAVPALAEALLALDALRNSEQLGNYTAPLRLHVAAPGKRSTKTCVVHLPQAPPCEDAVGFAGSSTDTQGLACQLCETTSLHTSFRQYHAAQLSTRALDALLQLQSRHGVTWLELLPKLEAHEPGALGASARQAGVAAGLNGLLGPNSAERMSRLRTLLQGVLDAGGLNMTPEDLATEGGLVATSKLAAHARVSAHAKWRSEFNAWSECHARAFADRKLPLPDPKAVTQCNAAHDAAKPSAVTDAARRTLLDYHASKHARRACLEATPCWDFVVTRSQPSCDATSASWLAEN